MSSPVVTTDVCGDPADLLLDFLNTLDVDEGTDVLDDPSAWRAWLDARHLPVGSGSARERAAVGAVRDDLRELARGGDGCVCELPVTVSIVAGGTVRLGGTDALGVVAACVAQLAVEGRLDRLKICPADDCAWGFYDTSRNRSRQWCSMAVCGNRAKSRAHRERAAVDRSGEPRR